MSEACLGCVWREGEKGEGGREVRNVSRSHLCEGIANML